jgi:rare lipoprotein A
MALAALAACRPPHSPTLPPSIPGGDIPPPGKVVERGIASWYGPGFHGKQTANGEVFDTAELTAAHKKLPFHTRVHVTNLDNGSTVVVRINDRGPFIRGRIIDLSRAAAEEIGMIGPGTARVELRLLGAAEPPPQTLTVQVGAFADRRRAEALALRLEGLHGPTRIVETEGLHRVQVGIFRDRETARKAAQELRQDGLEAVIRAVPES